MSKIRVKRLQIANGNGLSTRPIYKLADEPEVTIIPDGVTMLTKTVMIPQKVILFEGNLYVEVADASHD